MNQWLKRARENPKTSIVGLIKGIWGGQYLITHWDQITPEHLIHPERGAALGVALLFLASAASDLFAADAKDEIKASDVKGDTTLIGEK